MVEVSKVMEFGKVAFPPFNKKKACLVTANLSICQEVHALYKNGKWEETPIGELEVSVTAEVWNHIKTDCYVCGQCLEEVHSLYIENRELFNKIYGIWKRCHLKRLSSISKEDYDAIREILGENAFDMAVKKVKNN